VAVVNSGRQWWASAALGVVVLASSLLAPHLVEQRTTAAPAPSTPAPSPTANREAKPRPTTKPSPKAPEQITVAATASTNQLIGFTSDPRTACPTCASGSRLQYVGQGHGVVVPLHIPVAGERTLTIVYESENTRPLTVVLPSGTTLSLTLKGNGNWTTPIRHSVQIDLPAGDTKLTFFHATAPAPDLDQFVIG
jgi:hypothetical protein